MDSRAQKPHKSKTGKKSPCDQHTSPTAKPPEPDTSYARGGRVKKTGAAKLHKDEVVLPVAVVEIVTTTSWNILNFLEMVRNLNLKVKSTLNS